MSNYGNAGWCKCAMAVKIGPVAEVVRSRYARESAMKTEARATSSPELLSHASRATITFWCEIFSGHCHGRRERGTRTILNGSESY